MRNVNESYAIAITTYALQLATHSAKNEMLDKLNEMSINESGMKFWKRSDLGPEFKRPNSINIEMTAYALLAFLEADRKVESISIMKWLVTQRNENGGFQSTQDTIVGLQALAKLSSKIYSDNNDVRVSVKSLESNTVEFHVNSENSLVLQKQELPSKSRNFEINASGNGFSVLQISYRFNVPIKMASRFSLKPKVEAASNKEFLHLSICTKFIADSSDKESNMAVMEVTLPSGFTFDSDHLPTLKSFMRVKKVETKDGDTVVIVYFDNIDTREICPEIKAYRTHGVAKQKPVPVIIYDYYDNSRRTEAFYSPPEISLCDICGDDVECWGECEIDGVQLV